MFIYFILQPENTSNPFGTAVMKAYFMYSPRSLFDDSRVSFEFWG